MSWSSVINQEHAKQALRSSLQRGRLAHAYMFSGPPGVGKFAAAIELAKAVNCENKGSEPCDQCRNCIQIASLQHPDLSLVFALPAGSGEKSDDPPLAKLGEAEISLIHGELAAKARNPYHTINLPRANTIKINSIREIRKSTALTAFGGGKKVIVIIDADSMKDEASNALLKTLEEPHAHTMLILTTSRPEALLPTILSRCQLVRFEALQEEMIVRALTEREGLEPAQAGTIAAMADGSYSRALLYAQSGLGERMNEAVEFLRTILYKPRKTLLAEIERIASDYDRREIEDILRLLQRWLRDAMRAGEGFIDGGDEVLKKFITRYPAWNYGKAVESIDRAISLLSKNVYIPLVMTEAALNLKNAIDANAS